MDGWGDSWTGEASAIVLACGLDWFLMEGLTRPLFHSSSSPSSSLSLSLTSLGIRQGGSLCRDVFARVSVEVYVHMYILACM